MSWTAAKLTLDSDRSSFISTPVDLDPLTDTVSIVMDRPSILGDVTWEKSTAVTVTLVVSIDGEEYRYGGSASGGIRLDNQGNEIPYRFNVKLPVGWFGSKGVTPFRRLGENSIESYKAWVEIAWQKGAALSTNVVVTTTTAAADIREFHNSVQFDVASSASEEGGDLVVTVSITAHGSDRAVFAGGTSRSNTGAAFNSSATYDGVGMTEAWDVNEGTQKMQSSGYYAMNPATSAKNVVVTLAGGGTIYEQFVGVMTFTGVDTAGTPVGSAATGTAGSTPATVTVAGVNTDDMVVDCMIADGTTRTVGADQTEQLSFNSTFASRSGLSTQPGSAGGVMSWTVAATWIMGAIAFKTLPAGGGIFTPYFYQQHIASQR